MFNIGPQELIVVLVVALVVVGPKRLPELARAIGRGLNEFRKIQDEVKDMVKFDLGADLLATSEPEPTFPSLGGSEGTPDVEPEATPDVDPDGKTHSQRVIEALEDEPPGPVEPNERDGAAEPEAHDGVTALPAVASTSTATPAADEDGPADASTQDDAAAHDADPRADAVPPSGDPAETAEQPPPPAAAAE